MDNDALSEAIQSYTLYQHVKYMNLVCLSLYICEYFHQLELEIKLVWKAEWGFGNAIYIFARLLPFFDVPLVIFYRLYPKVPTLPNHVCDVLYKVETWCTVFGILATEAILAKMIYALTHRNQLIKWGLVIEMIAFSIVGIALWAILLNSLRFGPPVLPVPTGCYVVEGKYLFAGIGFILLALNELVFMILALGVGVSRYRRSNSTLVAVLYRDGTFYYVFLFAVSLGEVIIILAGPPEYADLLTTFQRVMHSILAARVMLNVRNTANRELNLPRTKNTSTGLSFRDSRSGGRTTTTTHSGSRGARSVVGSAGDALSIRGVEEVDREAVYELDELRRTTSTREGAGDTVLGDIEVPNNNPRTAMPVP
ncbi:hypothetical protein FA15DRAFT_246845 [Coprinopsis marcescibilis]|uniref:DUF6533 domain-containing protein n=1 Tax=Coprinopsis marcescibilis TaxID=230819 RepID=A0A5C3L366_COPMA|nr:hypothetical protein FA15DRAFT_246845 [Coprinopsis marcescibilis]